MTRLEVSDLKVVSALTRPKTSGLYDDVTYIHTLDCNQRVSPLLCQELWKKWRLLDLFEFSLLNRQGEQWKTWRSSLQHVMLKPNSVATWIPSMEECATDFIDLMAAHRDQNGEVPNYLGQIYKWALECKLMNHFIMLRSAKSTNGYNPQTGTTVKVCAQFNIQTNWHELEGNCEPKSTKLENGP